MKLILAFLSYLASFQSYGSLKKLERAIHICLMVPDRFFIAGIEIRINQSECMALQGWISRNLLILNQHRTTDQLRWFGFDWKLEDIHWESVDIHIQVSSVCLDPLLTTKGGLHVESNLLNWQCIWLLKIGSIFADEGHASRNKKCSARGRGGGGSAVCWKLCALRHKAARGDVSIISCKAHNPTRPGRASVPRGAELQGRGRAHCSMKGSPKRN